MPSTPTLYAGVARREITPPPGFPLVGYGNRLLPNLGAKDPLYVTALALQAGDVRVVLVTADLLAVSDATLDRVQQGIGAAVNAHVIIAASHTHSGPLPHADAASLPHYRRYVSWLVQQMTAAAVTAAVRTTPVHVEHGRGVGHIAVNRRERLPDGTITVGVNPDGPVDDALHVVRFLRADGTPLAHVVNYACHPTSLGPGNVRASADWVGAMRAVLEDALRVPCLFVQGACADLNPRNTHNVMTQWADRTALGQSVAKDVRAVLPRLTPFDALPLAVEPFTVRVPLVVGEGDHRHALADFARTPVAMVDPVLRLLFPWEVHIRVDGATTSVLLRGDVLRLGELAFIGLGAEVFNEIGAALKAAHPRLMVGGVTNGCIGYLPTPEEHDLGGYEVALSPYFFRLPGQLRRNAADIVTDAARSALERAYTLH